VELRKNLKRNKMYGLGHWCYAKVYDWNKGKFIICEVYFNDKLKLLMYIPITFKQKIKNFINVISNLKSQKKLGLFFVCNKEQISYIKYK